MNNKNGKAIGYFIFPIVLAVLLSTLNILPALAQGVGLSGNFYRQYYEMTPGEETTGDGIYVVVSNNSNEFITVKMTPQSPEGVEIIFDKDEFTLEAGENRKVVINVSASTEAVPGDYNLVVSAEEVREGGGIKIAGGSQQQADLTILGESGTVRIKTVNKDGESFGALIGIYQPDATTGELMRVRTPRQGSLESRLLPGEYTVWASYQDIKIVEENFSLDVNEEKEITLVCYTLCLTGFSVSPAYSGDEKITSVRIAYTITNLDKAVNDVRAMLEVELDDEHLDEAELVSFSTLDVGSQGSSSNYIPAQGWEDNHIYRFTIDLYSGDEILYQSFPQEVMTGQPGDERTDDETSTETTTSDNTNINWLVIGGIAGGAAVIIILVVLLIRRRRD